jgi:hypothetical protein
MEFLFGLFIASGIAGIVAAVLSFTKLNYLGCLPKFAGNGEEGQESRPRN